MKSKKTTWLIVLVLCIWGTVGYKIYENIDRDDEENVQAPAKKVSVVQVSKENYPLKLSYVDPFLKKAIAEKRVTTVARKPIQPRSEPILVPNVVVNWEKFEYAGTMFNASRNVILASLRIDGVDHMVKQGEVVDGFKIQNITKDSIQLVFGQQTKYIIKKK